MTRSLLASYLLILLLAFSQSAQSQLAVADTLTLEQLGESLVGSGIEVFNFTIDCPPPAYGSFDGSMTGIGLDAGVILTSGGIFQALGPNNSGSAGLDNSAPGDPVLTAVSGGPTNDACVFEFDVVPIADTVAFTYVFGSDEYLEFVDAFNDVFAFHITGPDIPVPQNMAIVPGTSLPVTINNINDVDFPMLYVDNGDGFTPPFSFDPFYIQYDGYTVPLVAKHAVTPCDTYHLRLAIADAVDWIYDSGVFIEAGSLTSFGVSLSQSTSVGFGFSNAVEGCVDGIITFTRDLVDSTDLIVNYGIGGDAVNGVDYTAISGSITIPGGSASEDLVINPIVDGIPEGIEEVVIYLLSECDGTPIDSITLGIQDEIVLALETAADTTICTGDTIRLEATGGLDYSWTPSGSLDDPLIPNPLATPPTTTTYTVVTTVGTCADTAMITINVSPPVPADAGPDVGICIGDNIDLAASGGVSYSWSPGTDLSSTSIPNPNASPTTTTTYTVVIADAFGCIGQDEITVTVNPLPIADASPNLTACPGDLVQLDATGGVSYSWDPTTDLSDPNIADPIFTANGPQNFTVTVTDANGCVSTASINIDVGPFPGVDAGLDTLVFFGESVTLDGSGDGDLFWMPGSTLSDPNIANPLATPIEGTWYILTATSEFGCQSIDSVFVDVIYDPIVEFPNAFSPNGDSRNDEFGVIVRGPVEIDVYQIFNRWGELVFEGSNINDAWDGTYKGKEQDVGTYVYHFMAKDPNGVPIELHGTLSLVR
jgi:gliding motility-associated-like protein